jgi:hypothetical protein
MPAFTIAFFTAVEIAMKRVTRGPYLSFTERGVNATRRVTMSGISLRPINAIIASACERASWA